MLNKNHLSDTLPSLYASNDSGAVIAEGCKTRIRGTEHHLGLQHPNLNVIRSGRYFRDQENILATILPIV